MIPILPTNDVYYTAAGVTVYLDGVLWPVEDSPPPTPSSGNRMGGTGAIRRRGGHPR